MSEPTSFHSPINLDERRARRVRAGSAAPDFSFGGPVAKRAPTADEVTESMHQRLREAEARTQAPRVATVYVVAFGLALTVGIAALLFNH